MKPFPTISVIVPCYNAAAYVGAALESILAQQPAPLDIILIDDGSTDASPEIAAAYGQQLRYYRQHNQGIGAARNQGVRLARGEWLAFLDADDLWTPDSLRLRGQRLADDPHLDGVFGWLECFISPELPASVQERFFCPPGAQPARMAGTLLIRRAAFERVGDFDTTLRVGEFMDWIARAQTLGIRLDASLETVVLRRRIHGANTVLTTESLRADYLRLLRAALARRRATESGP